MLALLQAVLAQVQQTAADPLSFGLGAGGTITMGALVYKGLDVWLKSRGRDEEMAAKHKTRTLIEAQGDRIAELVRAQERIADSLERISERMADMRADIRDGFQRLER
jgi:hypothetical protein